jgi:acyl dehydratase
MTTPAATPRYMDGFQVGQVFVSPAETVEEAEMLDFARRFDFQPFHLDAEAAKATMFKGLAASGWFTSALAFRLMLKSGIDPADGIIGAGIDELRWPRPVRAGDVVELRSEVLDVTPNAKNPARGVVRLRQTLVNSAGEVLYSMVGTILTRARPSSTT